MLRQYKSPHWLLGSFIVEEALRLRGHSNILV